jgi:hypothetical protein
MYGKSKNTCPLHEKKKWTRIHVAKMVKRNRANP